MYCIVSGVMNINKVGCLYYHLFPQNADQGESKSRQKDFFFWFDDLNWLTVCGLQKKHSINIVEH